MKWPDRDRLGGITFRPGVYAKLRTQLKRWGVMRTISRSRTGPVSSVACPRCLVVSPNHNDFDIDQRKDPTALLLRKSVRRPKR